MSEEIWKLNITHHKIIKIRIYLLNKKKKLKQITKIPSFLNILIFKKKNIQI